MYLDQNMYTPLFKFEKTKEHPFTSSMLVKNDVKYMSKDRVFEALKSCVNSPKKNSGKITLKITGYMSKVISTKDRENSIWVKESMALISGLGKFKLLLEIAPAVLAIAYHSLSSYDKPAPPRKVVNHAYDYPEFVAAPNPTPPIGHSYFGVDLGSLSDPEGSRSDQELSTPSPAPPTTGAPTGLTPVPTPAKEDPTNPDIEDRKPSPSSSNAAFVLQLIKLLRWPLVVVAVLGSCLLSGCSVGLFGRQCFDTNTHRRTVAPPKPRDDQDLSGDGLSLQTRRAIS